MSDAANRNIFSDRFFSSDILKGLLFCVSRVVSHACCRRHLTLDIPATPLFKDSQGGNIIPQIPLFKVLDKYNGQNWTVR